MHDSLFLCGKKFLPGVTAAQANDKILLGQTEGTQGINEQRDKFGVRRGIFFPDNVRVELEMLAQAAFLLAFVAVKLGNREPFNRLFVLALVRGHHARERGRHFRAERDVPFALVCKIVKLSDDFIAAFGGEQFQRLERRAIVFAKIIAARHFAPFIKDILAGGGAPNIGVRQWLRVKVTETWQSFHALKLKDFNGPLKRKSTSNLYAAAG